MIPPESCKPPLCRHTHIASINTPFTARRCRCPVIVMTDDRHYDLSITIVPGTTAPRKLQLIANIDCPRRRNCPPPGVTHNVSAPKICRGQPGAKTDSPGNVVAAGTRRPREHTRPIISQHCQFLCIFSRFFFLSFFFFEQSRVNPRVNSPAVQLETKAIIPLGNNGAFCSSRSVSPIDWRLT